jgi:hypothetical protein
MGAYSKDDDHTKIEVTNKQSLEGERMWLQLTIATRKKRLIFGALDSELVLPEIRVTVRNSQ